MQKEVRSIPKEAAVGAFRSEVFTEVKMAVKILCGVMLPSLLDILLQNVGTYQQQHTASHFRTKYSSITLTVIRCIFSVKPAEGNVKGNQPLWNRCPDVKCWILKSRGRWHVTCCVQALHQEVLQEAWTWVISDETGLRRSNLHSRPHLLNSSS
jgi:hypothetical protein